MKKGAKKRREKKRREKRREARKKARGAKKRREARRKGARREEKARGAKIRLSPIALGRADNYSHILHLRGRERTLVLLLFCVVLCGSRQSYALTICKFCKTFFSI